MFATGSVSGQNNLLTIEGAVKMAQQKNSEINQLKAQLVQKEQSWRTMTGISAPELSYFKEGINHLEIKPFDEKRWTISQSVDFPLTTYYRLKSVSEERKGMQLRVVSAEREIQSKVKEKYIEVIYGQHLKQLREQQIKLAQNLYNAVYSKFETGMGNGIDLTNAELQLAESQNDLDEAENIIHQARYGLFKLIGMDSEEQHYDIAFPDTLHTNDIGIAQIETLEELNSQPDYMAAAFDISAGNYQLKEARSNYLPDLRLNYYQQDYGTGYHYNGFEIGITLPVWFPFEQRGATQMAMARRQEMLYRQKSIELTMKEEIEKAWHSYSTSKSTVTRYRETIQAKAEKLHALALEAYRLGEIDLLNLISSQQAYLRSQQRYLVALRDYYIQLAHLEIYLNRQLVY